MKNIIIVMAINVLIIVIYTRFIATPHTIEVPLPPISSESSVSSNSSSSDKITVLVDPGYHASSSSLVDLEPVILEKAYRPPFVPRFPRSKWSTSSQSSANYSHQTLSSVSSSSSYSSSASKLSFCTGTGYLALYTNQGDRDAAIRFHTKICNH